MAVAYPLLLADIGGTNCRIGVVEAAGAAPRRLETVATASAPNPGDALRAVCARHGVAPASLALAVAGIVSGGRAELTNALWTFDIAQLCRELAVRSGLLVNDFAALAASLPGLGPETTRLIAPGRADPAGAAIVLGPGTGFGLSALMPHPGGFVIVPTEAGHVSLAPQSRDDAAWWPHLPQEDRVTCEMLLRGPGLALIAQARSAAAGGPAPLREPAAITQAAQEGEGEALAVVASFLDLLARVTGDMALAFKATGGVFLAGGVAQKLGPFIQTAHFATLFRDRPPMEALLREVPLRLVTVPDAAERGLAALVADPDRFGVRLWQAGRD